jgi:hypothetical protein
MIIACTGSREFSDEQVVDTILDRCRERFTILRIQVGDARGLDSLVAIWAVDHRIPLDRKICHWPPSSSTRQERWMAAHERNGRVIRGADLVLGFYARLDPSPGTQDALTQARAAGIAGFVHQGGIWRPL